MNPIKTHLFLLLLLHTHLSISSGFSDSGLNLLRNTEIDSLLLAGGGAAAGSVGHNQEELQMDSEVSRRLLIMQKRYISYETLKRDAVPCSVPGSSYYNCGSAQANRYSRGCEVITRCAKTTGG